MASGCLIGSLSRAHAIGLLVCDRIGGIPTLVRGCDRTTLTQEPYRDVVCWPENDARNIMVGQERWQSRMLRFFREPPAFLLGR